MRATAVLSLFLLAASAGAAIRGRIVGAGQPVANAKINAFAIEDGLSRVAANRPPAVLATTTSAADGTFALNVDGGGLVLVRVDAPSFAPWFSEEILGDDDVLIGLERKSPHQYTVLLPSGPVAGARVAVFVRNGGVIEATTDARGNFTIDDAGAVMVQVIDPRIAPSGVRAEPRQSIIPVEPAKAGADHILGAANGPISLSGVVRDAEQRPLRGVRLTLREEKHIRFAITGANGAYAFHVTSGPCQITALGDRITIGTVSLNVQSATVKDLVATPLPPVTGVVRGEDGSPVAGAQVTYAVEVNDFSYAFNESFRNKVPVFTTGADGRFRFVARHHQPVRLVAYKRGLPPAESDRIEPGKGEIVLTIREGVELAGTVVADRPLPGVALTVVPSGRYLLGTFSDPVLTDGEGRFSTRVAAGESRLVFSKSGYVTDVRPRWNAKAATGTMRVTLEPSMPIRGRVVHADGSGVVNVTVGDGVNLVKTAPDGSFALPDLRKGAHVIEYATKSGRRKQSIDAPADGVRLLFDDAVVLRGRVVDSSGSPVRAFNVSVTQAPSGSGTVHEFTDDAGRFVIDDAPLGPVIVSVRSKDRLDARQNATLQAGDSEELLIVMLRARTLRGKALAAGRPLEGVKVALDRPKPPPAATKSDGTFELSGVNADETTLTLSKSGFQAATLQVPAGDDDATLDPVELRPGVTLTGRVVDEQGKPVLNALVSAMSKTAGAPSVTTRVDKRGEFVLDGLAAETYTVSADTAYAVAAPVLELFSGEVRVDVERVHDVTIHVVPVPAGAVVYGDVTGIEGKGTPITVLLRSAEERSWVTIAGSGPYRVQRAPTGVVTAQAYANTEEGVRWTPHVFLELSPGAEARADLRFAPTFPISGRVLRNGVPLPGATVYFSDFSGNQFHAQSDGSGAYKSFAVAGRFIVSVGSYSIERDIDGPGIVDVDVQVRRVNVTVVDAETGNPIDDATVTARDLRYGAVLLASEMTASNGQAILDVSPLAGDIVVEKEGYASAASAAAPSVVVKLSRGGGVVLRTADASNGRPISASVIARDAQGRVLAFSDQSPDGVVRFTLAPGTYRFSASASGYGSQTVTADVPSQGVTLSLPYGGKLVLQSRLPRRGSARLIQANGEEYVRCWCNGKAQIAINGRTTVIDSVAPGSYTLEIVEAGAKPRTLPVTVVERQRTTVAIDP